MIDASGHFELVTLRPGDGVIPDKYNVTVGGPGVPAAYGRTETSNIDFDIQQPTSNLEIVLIRLDG